MWRYIILVSYSQVVIVIRWTVKLVDIHSSSIHRDRITLIITERGTAVNETLGIGTGTGSDITVPDCVDIIGSSFQPCSSGTVCKLTTNTDSRTFW